MPSRGCLRYLGDSLVLGRIDPGFKTFFTAVKVKCGQSGCCQIQRGGCMDDLVYEPIVEIIRLTVGESGFAEHT